jgi:hypothetical protein
MRSRGRGSAANILWGAWSLELVNYLLLLWNSDSDVELRLFFLNTELHPSSNIIFITKFF